MSPPDSPARACAVRDIAAHAARLLRLLGGTYEARVQLGPDMDVSDAAQILADVRAVGGWRGVIRRDARDGVLYLTFSAADNVAPARVAHATLLMVAIDAAGEARASAHRRGRRTVHHGPHHARRRAARRAARPRSP